MNFIPSTVVLFILVKTALQECGDVLEGAVVCIVDPHIKLMDTFDFKLCSHCVIDGVNIDCDDTVCEFKPDQDSDLVIRTIQRYFPQELGIYFGFDDHRTKHLLGNALRSNNTINAMVDFLEQKGLSFVLTSGASQRLSTEADKANYLLFLQAWSSKLHERGLHLSQELNVGRGNILKTNFNITEVAKLVDWYYLQTRDLGYSGYMQPFTPFDTHHGRSSGTTKFWVKKVLQLVNPKCLVIDLGPRVERHRATQTKVQPGPGSLSTLTDSGKLDVSEVCNVVGFRGPGCQEWWDDESSTPWAVCGNDYYTYENARSLRIKAEYLKQMNISGVLIYTHDMKADNECENGNPLEVFKAVQIIRRK